MIERTRSASLRSPSRSGLSKSVNPSCSASARTSIGSPTTRIILAGSDRYHAHGKVIAIGTLDELRDLVGERDLVQLTGHFEPEGVRRAMDGYAGVDVVTSEPDTLVLAAEGASRRLPDVFAAVSAAGGEIRETTLRQPSLETLFIKLTGRDLRE